MNKISLFIISFWVGGSFAQQGELQTDQFCGTNSQAKQLAQLVIRHPSQKRPLIQCNQLLTSIAQQRAEQLANNSADSEITPNQILIKGGFRVPSYYPVSGNQVEALAKDVDQAELAIQYFIQSGKYHDHVLGKGEFFALQSELGVGFFKANDVTQHDQWVVLAAEPWQSQKIVFKQEKFKMPIKVAEGCDKDWKNGHDELLKSKCRGMGRAQSKKSDNQD